MAIPFSIVQFTKDKNPNERDGDRGKIADVRFLGCIWFNGTLFTHGKNQVWIVEMSVVLSLLLLLLLCPRSIAVSWEKKNKREGNRHSPTTAQSEWNIASRFVYTRIVHIVKAREVQTEGKRHTHRRWAKKWEKVSAQMYLVRWKLLQMRNVHVER